MLNDFPADVLQTHRDRGTDGGVSDWVPRLFKNTYTRGGRRIELGKWSVKIQHQGQRRTFSLSGHTRHAAATEAKAIHETILAEGWDVALREQKSGSAFPRTDVRYWKEWLLLRRYRFPGSGGAAEDLAA